MLPRSHGELPRKLFVRVAWKYVVCICWWAGHCGTMFWLLVVVWQKGMQCKQTFSSRGVLTHHPNQRKKSWSRKKTILLYVWDVGVGDVFWQRAGWVAVLCPTFSPQWCVLGLHQQEVRVLSVPWICGWCLSHLPALGHQIPRTWVDHSILYAMVHFQLLLFPQGDMAGPECLLTSLQTQSSRSVLQTPWLVRDFFHQLYDM